MTAKDILTEHAFRRLFKQTLFDNLKIAVSNLTAEEIVKLIREAYGEDKEGYQEFIRSL